MVVLIKGANIADNFTSPTNHPAIRLGEDQEQPGDFQSLNGAFSADVFIPLVVLTQSTGFLQAKQIAAEIMQSVLGTITVGNQRVFIRFAGSRFARSANGQGQRASITFHTRVMEAAA